jgi:AraC-like DNA-binding protein
MRPAAAGHLVACKINAFWSSVVALQLSTNGGITMGQHLAVASIDLDGFEGMHNAVRGTHFDVVQLGRGRLHGSLAHVGVGNFSLSVGSFDVGIRVQRISTDDKLIVGMLLGATDRVVHWSFDLQPADVLVIPPLIEHHGVFRGAASYAAIRLDPDELSGLFAGEPRLSDPDNWREKRHYRAHPAIGILAAQKLPLIVDRLTRQDAAVSEGAAQFWKRTIVECMTATVASSLPPEKDGHLPSALKLVRHVEEYLEAAGDRPLHISEICHELRSSRRSLHRAFHAIFGVGPVTFLRKKRLCAVHSTLKRSAPNTTTVTRVALEQGFVELGRFSQYYRVMFGEYPSQTLQSVN